MKKNILKLLIITVALLTISLVDAQQNEISIEGITVLGQTKPIPVSIDGFSGEVAEALKFDLYVQGFTFVSPDAAQYVISGSNASNVQGQLADKLSKKTLFSRSYTGASLRKQAHAFADDIVLAVTGKKGIAQTKIAFRGQPGGVGKGEIFIADFDGRNSQAITHDGTIVSAPSWVSGRLALCYNSYKLDNPDIFFHDLTTGQRKPIARYGGSNISPAVSPDGTKVAMVLSKGGSPNIYVANLDGTDLKRLTTGVEDSSPCWSPDGQWICFATKQNERRVLAKVPVSGGVAQRIPTSGVLNPTEPDWSPDGKWIAFTSQMGDFNICVIPATGGTATVIVPGEDPSWSANSRTVVCALRAGGRYTLSVLDVFTKQSRNAARVTGNDSEPSWAR